MKRILPIVAILFILLAIPWRTVLSYVSGGAGKVILSPASSQLQINQDKNLDIVMSTGGVPISTVAVRITFPVSNDLTVVSVSPNASLATVGWFFQINSVNTDNNITTIDLVGINTRLAGYATSVDVPLATITLKATAAFTNRTLTFDTNLTKMIGKINPVDILGTLGNGTYSTATSGTTITPTPTHTPASTPTNTPTPTPGAAGSTNTTPSCTSITTNPSTERGAALTVTIACYGVDPDGYLSAGLFEFGDGRTATVERNAGSPGSFTTSHAYSQIGTYEVKCKVRDNNNVWSPTTDACKKYITFRTAESGTTVVVTTPSPQAMRTTTPTITPSITEFPTIEPTEALTPIPTEVYTPPTPSPTTSPPWLLVGSAGLIILGFLMYVFGRK